MDSIDLFCGTGGISQGLKQANIKVIAGVDYMNYAVKTWDHNQKTIDRISKTKQGEKIAPNAVNEFEKLSKLMNEDSGDLLEKIVNEEYY